MGQLYLWKQEDPRPLLLLVNVNFLYYQNHETSCLYVHTMTVSVASILVISLSVTLPVMVLKPFSKTESQS